MHQLRTAIAVVLQSFHDLSNAPSMICELSGSLSSLAAQVCLFAHRRGAAFLRRGGQKATGMGCTGDKCQRVA